MVPDLTLEVIYYKQPTDFKMEFDLCGNCNVRFLSCLTKDKKEFVTALGKSVARSRAIIAVGSFNPLDNDYLPKLVAKATGYILKSVDKQSFSIEGQPEYPLPETSIPLITSEGILGGCVLESNDQSIIMLSSERELRHTLISELVCPYLQIFASKRGKTTPPEERILPPVVIEEKAEENLLNQDVGLPEEEKDSLLDQPLTPQEQTDDNIESNITESANENEVEIATQNTDNNVPAIEDTPLPVNENYTVLEEAHNTISTQNNLADFLAEDSFEEQKSKKQTCHRGFKIILSIILVIAVLLSAFFGYEFLYQPMQNSAAYKNALELYGQAWDGLPEDMLYKFGKLYQTNNDIFGWLSLPENDINFPVVSAAEKGASYYQTHSFDGSVNRYGTPYTTSKTSEYGYARNIVINGQNIKSGLMFNGLNKYLDIEHYRSAPTFSFDTLYLEKKWKIFAVLNITDNNKSRLIKTSFFDDTEFLSYIDYIKSNSVIKTSITVSADDRLVTLVSEGGSSNVAIVARMVRNGESPLVDVTDSEINDNLTADQSSAIQAITTPSNFKELTSAELFTSDSALVDGASSRYEQQAPTQSTIVVKPNSSSSTPKPSSTAPSSSKPTTTSKPSSTSTNKPSSSSSSKVSSTTPTPTGKLPTLTVTNNFNGKKVTGAANDIVAQILEAEMGSHYHIEALKAQAVAAYSWLLCNGAASGKYPEAPMKTAGARAKEAANAVAGVVAAYGGNVAQTYYYAISAGKTANSSHIWTSQISYLVSVDSSVDKNVSGYQTVRSYAASDIANWAKESLGVDLNKITDKSKWFTCTYDSNNLYVVTVQIGGVSKKGPYLRNNFFTSSRVGSKNVLRSSAYTIEYNKSDDKFVFTVKGYGHGVGMSQAGANVYAKSGWDYETILKHYYTGISLATYFEE